VTRPTTLIERSHTMRKTTILAALALAIAPFAVRA
jgi:hypothetical protein